MLELLPVTTAVGIFSDEIQDSELCSQSFSFHIKDGTSSPEMTENRQRMRFRIGTFRGHWEMVVVHQKRLVSKQRITDLCSAESDIGPG